MTRINTNVPSLVAQNRLQSSNKDLQTALTRLSTGLRINKGSDDPAGLIASEALRSEITSLNKSITNTRRASQIISTADSALGQVSSLLNDIRGLVVEAANSGALSPDEISANQLQVDSSLEAINRIAQTTTFQGRKLLDGSLDFITTNGAGASNIQNLKIDQANLGATGSIAVTINVATAATRAEVDVSGFTGGATTPSAKASATLNISSNVTEGTATLDLTIGGAEFTISADDAGEAGNATVVFTDTTGVAPAAAYDADTNTITVSFDFADDVDAADIAAEIDGLNAGFTTSGATGSTGGDTTPVTPADTVLAGGATGNTASSITVTADDFGADSNVEINFIDGGTGSETTAGFNSTTGAIEVTYDFSAATAASAIQSAIDDLDGFSATLTGSGNTVAGTAATNSALTGGFLLGDSVSATDTLQISTVSAGAAAELDFTIGGAEFTVTADDVGAAGNATVVFADTTGVAPAAAYDADTNTLTISFDFADDVDAADIAAEIDGLNAGFTTSGATGSTGGDTTPVTPADTALAGGLDASTASSIKITADKSLGADGNVAVTFINGGASSETSAAINSTTGAVEITYDFAAATTAADLAAAINELDGFSATVTGSGSTTAGTGATAGALEGGITGGVQADLVFELAGSNGSEVFNISKGTSLSQVVSQINLVSDATGVTAAANEGVLEIRSSSFGSAAVVDLRILTQATGGNFGTGSRDTGSDVVATVNGRAANGVGNKLSINTATLDLTADIAADFEGDASFTITGGGAQFQLGPEVVSNQQARVGIGSVNAARLGGVAGKLFELGSGEAAALATDPTRAAQIVSEAIDQVTSLRGRLGAFQATTLESNLTSLNDTVANLQEAESSIRDADFAQESAKLTRAQILVQSGTNVLALANQNPQNVLSLLR